jgi:hypothetical protein
LPLMTAAGAVVENDRVAARIKTKKKHS